MIKQIISSIQLRYVFTVFCACMLYSLNVNASSITVNINDQFQDGATFTGTLTYDTSSKWMTQISGIFNNSLITNANINTLSAYSQWNVNYSFAPLFPDIISDHAFGTNGIYNILIALIFDTTSNTLLLTDTGPLQTRYYFADAETGDTITYSTISTSSNVPEPTTIALVGLGLLAWVTVTCVAIKIKSRSSPRYGGVSGGGQRLTTI